MSTQVDIRKAIATRVAALGTVVRGRRQFSTDDLPAVLVYMDPRTVDEERGERYRMDGQIVVEYHKRIDGEADDQGDAMLAELRALVEIEPRTIDGLVINPGISFAGDEIVYPEDSGGVMAVKAAYSAPHIDRFGN